MANLLNETIQILKYNGKSLNDVEWIGLQDGYITLDEFEKHADRYYDNGYGGVEVNDDLIIMGKDWYLTRGEYDGSEWWDYHSMDKFKKPENKLENIMLFY